ncbi:RDD family protein [Asticcacaulis sp. AND118]|uniref:RDD family protein n=1 Tax=Asticcacaulis sp. AND118 TaxID=2840468 RepID=UPI001CFF871D|nr:RDD family protein [Asticcacaulis sp. AND118]UDF04911.1 RDD family protein [Asticcacaulis sp. AND118]
MAKRDLMKGGAATLPPLQGPVTPVTTPEGVVLSFRTASFAARLGALVIDFLIIILAPVALVLLYFILPFEHLKLDGAKMDHPVIQAMMILFVLIGFFLRSGYFMFFELGPRAATPGKRLMKIRVISHDGGHLSPAGVITRNALREVELYLPMTLAFQASVVGGWLALVALLWTLILALLPLFNASRARLGDFLGGTRVVYVPREKLSFDLAEQVHATPSALIFTPEQISVYGEKELGVLEEVLRERRAPTMRAVADRIKTRIGWVTPKAVTEIPSDEAFLSAYYAALRAQLEGRMLMGRRRKDKFDE